MTKLMKLQHVQAGSGAGTVAIQICSSPSALGQPSRLTRTLLRIPSALFAHLKARHAVALIATFKALEGGQPCRDETTAEANPQNRESNADMNWKDGASRVFAPDRLKSCQ